MNILQYFFNILFIILLALPFGLTICGTVPNSIFLTENRALTEKPQLKKISLRHWPKKLDPWFQDQLAFRSHLVGLYLYLWEDCLQSPIKDFATGRNGEWFPIIKSESVLQNFLGLKPLSKKTLIQFKLAYTGMYAALKTYGIHYLLVTIPDKPSIYPEKLPFWAHWNKGQSHYNQLTSILKEIDVPWIDMFPLLIENKTRHNVYCTKFNTVHWNGYGRELAYHALGKTLAQWNAGFIPKPKGIFYDIYYNEALSSHFTKEYAPFIKLLQAKNICYHGLPEFSKEHLSWLDPQLLINSCPLTLWTVWFASDSYFLAAFQSGEDKTWEGDLPLIAHHTKQFLKMHIKHLNLSLLQQSLEKSYRPHLVIETFVERNRRGFTRASDPLIRIFGDIYLNTPGHILTPDTIEHLMCGMHTCLTYTPRTKDNIGIFTATTQESYIYLPSVTTDADGRAMLAVQMYVPVKTITKLYYAPAGTQTFDDQHAVAIELEQGEHLIHLSFIDEPHTTMDLRFHPGCHPGEYRILPMPNDIQTFQRIHKNPS